MANRWLFAGGDIGMMRLAGSPATSTTGGRYDSAYADHGISASTTGVGTYTDFLTSAGASDSVTTGETLWFHVNHYATGTGTVNNWIEILNGSDQPWVALRNTSSGNAGLYYNSNTGASPTWTLIGSIFAMPSATLEAIDITVTLGSPHSASVYVDGVQKATGTFTQASFTAADAVLCKCAANAVATYSEFMATVGISTVGGHVRYGKPSAAGSNSGWTGAYTTIDDVGVDDADLISSAVAGQRSTFAYTDLPSLAAGYATGDLFMWTRGKNDGAAPANIKPVRRSSGGTDNVGSSFSGVGAGFAEFLTRYSGISATEYNASEFGVESAT